MTKILPDSNTINKSILGELTNGNSLINQTDRTVGQRSKQLGSGSADAKTQVSFSRYFFGTRSITTHNRIDQTGHEL